jgi:hypothetical protein
LTSKYHLLLTLFPHGILKVSQNTLIMASKEVIMIGKLLATTRDLILFFLLMALIQIALKDTKSYILEHKKSLIHELDRNFIDQLYTAQRQLHSLEEHPIHADTFATTIADLKSRLSTIEEQYKKNSPGLALLGPIGTAAIVTKEEQLMKKLLTVVNDLGNMLHQTAQHEVEFQPALTVSNALKNNKQLMKLLVT